MATNAFYQDKKEYTPYQQSQLSELGDQSGVTRLYGTAKPQQQQPQMPLGYAAPAPTQLDPRAFSPMIQPFVGAFNQAGQAEATGIADLRLSRLLDNMAKQRQIQGLDAVLPYAGRNAALQGDSVITDMLTKLNLLPGQMEHQQAQTGLMQAQTQAVPGQNSADMMRAEAMKQSSQVEKIKLLENFLVTMEKGPLKDQVTSLLLQDLAPQLLQQGQATQTPAAPATPQPQGTSLGSKIAAGGAGAAIGASGAAGAIGGRALGSAIGAPLGPVGSVVGGITLPFLMNWLLNQNDALSQSMSENPGTTGLGMLASGAAGYKANKAMTAKAKAKTPQTPQAPQLQQPFPPVATQPPIGVAGGPTMQTPGATGPGPVNPFNFSNTQVPAGAPTMGGGPLYPRQTQAPSVAPVTGGRPVYPTGQAGYSSLDEIQKLLLGMGLQPNTPAYIAAFKAMAGIQ